jgi:hypothetical protein
MFCLAPSIFLSPDVWPIIYTLFFGPWPFICIFFCCVTYHLLVVWCLSYHLFPVVRSIAYRRPNGLVSGPTNYHSPVFWSLAYHLIFFWSLAYHSPVFWSLAYHLHFLLVSSLYHSPVFRVRPMICPVLWSQSEPHPRCFLVSGLSSVLSICK